jgi:maleate isomerase
MFGWRARIGVLYPVTGSTTLAEWNEWAPDGIAFSPSPFDIVDVLPENIKDREDDLARAAACLRSANVDATVQVGTPFGFVAGLAGDRSLNDRLNVETGAPATSMMRACVDALTRLDIRRPVVVTAYVDGLNALLVDRLAEEGIEPVLLDGLGYRSNLEINSLPATVAYRAAMRGWDKSRKNNQIADGIFIVCGGLATFEIIRALELDTGLPVVSSNSAGLWAGMRLARVNSPIVGLGRLFAVA